MVPVGVAPRCSSVKISRYICSFVVRSTTVLLHQSGTAHRFHILVRVYRRLAKVLSLKRVQECIPEWLLDTRRAAEKTPCVILSWTGAMGDRGISTFRETDDARIFGACYDRDAQLFFGVNLNLGAHDPSEKLIWTKRKRLLWIDLPLA